MQDTALSLLLAHKTSSDKNIWFADENIAGETIPNACDKWRPKVISNRINVVNHFQALDYPAEFSDFDCSAIADETIDVVHYRISKEKAAVHHIINQSYRMLNEGGQLIISGLKKEGIKTYIKKAASLFAGEKLQYKDKPHTFCAVLTKAQSDQAEYLNDKNYQNIRLIGAEDSFSLYSKPGVFGWEKIDKGSAFLVEHLADFLSPIYKKDTLLDLGCGYGYLSLMASQYGFKQISATDNNAAALKSCEYNFSHHKLNAITLADDCAANIKDKFDIILCNPPFHQGFSIEGVLTDQFLSTAKRLLTKKGAALFVINSFIPLERKAQQYFDHVEIFAENRSFKLVRCQQ